MKTCWLSSRHIFNFNSNIFSAAQIIIFVLNVFLIPTALGGPLTHHPPEADLDVGNNSLAAPGPSPPVGCRYQGGVFAPGEEVPTEEPCLLCQCKSAVVCKLRICPEIPVPPPPGCIVVHKAKKCCAQLVCNQHLLGHETNRKLSREQKLPAVNSSLSSTLAAAEGKGYCVVDGTVYAEGSAMRSSSLCQYCFCIRGEMKCSKPQCVIPMNGCRPKFRSYACCPTNYDCQDSNSTAVVKTTPTSTPIPQFLKGCLVNGKKIAEGEPVLPLQLENHTNPCQTCFCMGGVIHCRPLECDRPIEGCKPITEHGHCCPDRYDCSHLNELSKSKSHEIVSANLVKASEDVTVSSTTMVPSTVSTAASTTTDSTTIRSTTFSTTTTTPVPTTVSTTASTTTAAVPSTTTAVPTTTTAVPTTMTAVPTTTSTTTTTTTTTPETTTTSKTTERAEILPEPASMKMTTSGEAPMLAGPSSERKLNGNSRARNKSDAGSREERQNKDRNHFRYRTSYEDDEKDDSASLSYENTEHENADPNSSLSLEETTDNSGSSSDSEMESDNTEISPTEENSVEVGIEGRSESSETKGETSLPSEPEVNDMETQSQKSGASTITNSLGDIDAETEPEEIKVQKLGTKNPTGLTPSLTDLLTSTPTTARTTTAAGSGATPVSPTTTTTDTAATILLSTIIERVGSAGGDSLKEVEGTNTSTSSSSLGGLSQDSQSNSDSGAEITGSSIINQDVENTEVSSSASPTMMTTPTTTTAKEPINASTNPTAQPQPSSETTVKNVHFISFGVEDAVVSPMNETLPPYESQLAYDNHALKISLIPPTPPKGYPKRIPSSSHHKSQNSSGGASGSSSQNQSTSSQGSEVVNSTAGSVPGRKDELGNAIMDVPVSTSLYNNGFYRSGGMIITDDSQRGSLELEISSNRPFPGQVFDDGHHSSLNPPHGIQIQHVAVSPPPVPSAPAPVPSPIPNPHKKIFESQPLPHLLTSIKPPYPSAPLPTLSGNNPARTYSKFGIQDSTYYRYGYGNGNGNNPPHTNPQHSPIGNQHHQYHHRYYNAPEHEHVLPPQHPYADLEQVINTDQDDVTYEEVDDDDAEGVSFEEQSVENQENQGGNQFNYQKNQEHVSVTTLRYPTVLPTFVFPQNPLEETSTPIYNSSTKIQIQIPHNNQHHNHIASASKKVAGYNYNYNKQQQPPQKAQPQREENGKFKPAVAFPFALPKKPTGTEFNLGLKLSGCNIYGKMYNVEDVILELSSSCVRCLCTEVGVQCSEIPC